MFQGNRLDAGKIEVTSGSMQDAALGAELLRRRFSFPEGVRHLIVSAATAEKHQGHQPASDGKRKERAKAKRDPTVFGHRDARALIPERDRPHACREEDGHQRY
jgi:hypothetical protein